MVSFKSLHYKMQLFLSTSFPSPVYMLGAATLAILAHESKPSETKAQIMNKHFLVH